MAYPYLYQINTRVWLGERSRQLGRRATLQDIPDQLLDEIVARGFDYVWFLGVWQTGPAGRAVSLAHPEWLEEYRRTLPDFSDADVSGSPFAIQRYALHSDFGGPEDIAALRDRIHARKLKLILDFVPNHTAMDHPWVEERPKFYVHGTSDDLAREPQNYRRVKTSSGERILAHGRDPYFPGWPDTLQLNYRHPELRAAMTGELLAISKLADGVRCDMALLILPEVFARTWGERARPGDGATPVDDSFWSTAIKQVRQANPGFLFMAEVYWDLEWALMQQGFDFTYDKRLYDRLHAQDAVAVRDHLHADMPFQRGSVRFLENHDEPRAASVFPQNVHRAAAVIAFLVPGMRFFHEGQLEGRRTRVSMHLGRRPEEPVDEQIRSFYLRLLEVLKRPELWEGRWLLLECRPAWDGNPTWDRYIAFMWVGTRGGVLVTVNYGPSQGQCYVSLPLNFQGRHFVLNDLLGSARYERNGDELAARGFYLDMPAWGFHVFEFTTA